MVAWTRKHGESRVVGIQPGHGGDIFVDPDYQRFIRQAVFWAAKRDAAPETQE